MGVRAGLAALLALLGYTCVTQTYAYSIRNKDPEGAHKLAPQDGRIASVLAQKLSGPEATDADLARAGRIARNALLQDPTTVTAASTLGIVALLRDDTDKARRLFAYAESLSRRDLRTELWAIEDAVGREDINGALRHYDIALRGSRNASGVLFPVLASAIDDATIRAALTKTLAGKPVWGALFVEYVSANGPDPKSTSLLFQELRRARVPISEVSQGLLVDALASRGMFEEAWTYYASIRQGADRRRSRDPMFATHSASPTLMDWQLVPTEGLSASIQQLDRAGVLDFAAPAGIGGPLIQQVQLLPAGSYHLSGHSISIDQPHGVEPYWVLSCRSGRELGRVAIPNSSQNNGNFSGRFDVPADCPVQSLTFVVRPTDAVAQTAGQIDRVQLAPLP